MAIAINFLYGAVDSATYATKTWTAVPLGTPAADREIIVAVGTNNNTTSTSFWPISVTVDGVPLTLDAHSTQNSRIAHAAVFRGLIPTGTSADIVVTKYANNGSRNGIVVWSMTGRGTEVGTPPLDTKFMYFSTSGTNDLPAVQVAEDGALIGFIQRSNSGNTTWNNMSEDYDGTPAGTGATTGSHMLPSADDPAFVPSITFAGGAGRNNAALLVSYGVSATPSTVRNISQVNTNYLTLDIIPPVEGGTSSTLINIPESNVNSDLENFVIRVDLADMGSDFWNNVTPSGENIRVFSDDGTIQFPVDVIRVDMDNQEGELFFKASLSSDLDNVFDIRTTEAVSPDGLDTPYGRHAVWSDYAAIFVFTDMFNRAASASSVSIDGTAATHAYAPTAVGPDVASHQGVAYDGTNFYVMHTNRLRKYNGSWVLQATNSDPLGDTGVSGVNHMGDVFYKDGELFSVFEKYPNSPYNNQHVGVWNASDLSFNRVYDISANLHEVSSITWDPINSWFVITDYTAAGATVLHKYDTSFNYLGTITTSSISQKQGIDYYNNKYWITTAGKKLFSVNLDGSGLTEQWSGSISGYMEGLASKGDGTFYILFDGTPSAVYTFSPTSGSGVPGWLTLGGSGNARFTVPKLTNWTMGASVVPSSVAANSGILSYGVAETGNTNRASLMIRPASSKFGLWNSSDTWLDATGAAPTIGVRARVHHTQLGTTNRRIYQNGVLSNTDSGVSQRPGGAGNVLFIGAEDTSFTERLSGRINYAYLRSGELSADWIAAEYASWEGSGFYTLV